MWLLFEVFKYLRSSMHGCLYTCLRIVILAVLSQVSRVVGACAFIHMHRD